MCLNCSSRVGHVATDPEIQFFGVRLQDVELEGRPMCFRAVVGVFWVQVWSENGLWRGVVRQAHYDEHRVFRAVSHNHPTAVFALRALEDQTRVMTRTLETLLGSGAMIQESRGEDVRLTLWERL